MNSRAVTYLHVRRRSVRAGDERGRTGTWKDASSALACGRAHPAPKSGHGRLAVAASCGDKLPIIDIGARAQRERFPTSGMRCDVLPTEAAPGEAPVGSSPEAFSST